MEQTIRRLVRIATVTLCAAAPASAAVATQASAATITVDQACYVNLHRYSIANATRPHMIVTGTGFGPNDQIDISGPSAVFDAVTADANGNFVANTFAPIREDLSTSVRTGMILASDQTTTSLTASVPVAYANLSISIGNLTQKTVGNVHTDRVTYHFSGFTPGQHIVAYYVHNKRLKARSVFRTAQGPCGTLTQRALLYPGGHPAIEKYSVTFESVMHYETKAVPRLTATLGVFHY